MKFKAVLSRHAPDTLSAHLNSEEFARALLTGVCGDVFGVEDVLLRTAEYYVQEMDRTIRVSELIGAEIRLTGVSRGNRPAKMFHDALRKLERIFSDAIVGRTPTGVHVQVYCAMMLDAEVETYPGSGMYSTCLESKAKIVEGALAPLHH